MATDSEIYRAANLLIQEFGEMAPIGAQVKADQMQDRGDRAARSVWLRVARATQELLSDSSPDAAVLN
ncbi:MAG TPA: hypothetical protein DC046_10885 [Rhodospirillaceae bacterium]|nr:hypothetical protein [Rhodospirillaceae bacterium]